VNNSGSPDDGNSDAYGGIDPEGSVPVDTDADPPLPDAPPDPEVAVVRAVAGASVVDCGDSSGPVVAGDSSPPEHPASAPRVPTPTVLSSRRRE
jgi:hypothetical protein